MIPAGPPRFTSDPITPMRVAGSLNDHLTLCCTKADTY